MRLAQRKRREPRQKPGTNQTLIKALIRKISGQNNVLTIPRVFIELTGDVKGALLLSQCLYWSDRGSDPDGWFYKAHDEWAEELGLSEHDIVKWAGTSKTRGRLGLWLEVKLKKARGAPTTHYRVKIDKLIESVSELLLEQQAEAEAAEQPGSAEAELPDSTKIHDLGGAGSTLPEYAKFAESISAESRIWIVRELRDPHTGDSTVSRETYTETAQITSENKTDLFTLLVPIAAAASGSQPPESAQGEPRMPRTSTEIWQAALPLLQAQMPKGTFNAWVKPSCGLAYEQGVFVVGAASGPAKEWLENSLDRKIKSTLAWVLGRPVETRYTVHRRAPYSDEEDASLRYHIGLHVRHAEYGEGVVTDCGWTEDQRQEVTVDFGGTSRCFEIALEAGSG